MAKFKPGDKIIPVTEHALFEHNWRLISGDIGVLGYDQQTESYKLEYVSNSFGATGGYYNVNFIDNNFIISTTASKVLYGRL